MEQRTDRIFPPAPQKTIELEQRLENKFCDVNSFKNHISSKKK